MEFRFEGKRALVTGGSRGLGRGIVKALIDAGAEVFAIGKSQENLDKLKTYIPSVNTVCVDLADWDATKREVERVGDIDLLVNNAAMIDRGILNTPFVDVEKSFLDATLDVNLKAAFNVAQVVARGMIKRENGGAIVNMSSIAGIKPHTGLAPYCVSKAGLDMLTKVMALELGQHKIRVNAVCPTGINPDKDDEKVKEMLADPSNQEMIRQWKERIKRHPLGKLVDIEDVVNATMFLLSDRASMITGTLLPVDSGFLIS